MSDSDTLQAMFRMSNEIRAKLHEHDARFDAVDHRFDSLEKKIEDWQETTATAAGFETHANIRNTAIEAELEALKRRVAAIEGSLGTTGH